MTEKVYLHKSECEYRALRRDTLTERFTACGCREVSRLFPEQTGFYQPIVIAKNKHGRKMT